MSFCPVRASKSAFKPVSNVMNRVAPWLWLKARKRATRSCGISIGSWETRATSSARLRLAFVGKTGETSRRRRFQ